jgi:hypothetical protein
MYTCPRCRIEVKVQRAPAYMNNAWVYAEHAIPLLRRHVGTQCYFSRRLVNLNNDPPKLDAERSSG